MFNLLFSKSQIRWRINSNNYKGAQLRSFINNQRAAKSVDSWPYKIKRNSRQQYRFPNVCRELPSQILRHISRKWITNTTQEEIHRRSAYQRSKWRLQENHFGFKVLLAIMKPNWHSEINVGGSVQTSLERTFLEQLVHYRVHDKRFWLFVLHFKIRLDNLTSYLTQYAITFIFNNVYIFFIRNDSFIYFFYSQWFVHLF